jgi:hypothetical protein
VAEEPASVSVHACLASTLHDRDPGGKSTGAVPVGQSRQHITPASARLPNSTLVPGPGETRVGLVPPRRSALVVVLPHSTECAGCERFLRDLAGHDVELEAWDVGVVVVYPEDPERAAPRPARHGFRSLYDPERSLERTVPGEPAVLVADRWRKVHDVIRIGEDHAVPDADEVVAWGRFLAMRCPECEGEAL